MKNLKIITLIMALSCLNGSNAATTSTPIQVSANVDASCNITTGNISFGSIQLGTAGSVSSAGTNFLADCAEGVNYRISWDGGLNFDGTMRRLKHINSNEYIEYELDLGDLRVGVNENTLPGTGDGIGKNSDRQIFAIISNNQSASSGNYSDIVTMTIEY